MSKVIVLDGGGMQFRAIFAYRANPQMPCTYTYMSMLIGYLNKIGIDENTKIIIAQDYGSWRKGIDPIYKAQRQGDREEKEEKQWWLDRYAEFNDLYTKLDLALPFHFIKIYKCESDDIASVCFLGNTYIAAPFKNRNNRQIRKINKGDKIYSYNIENNEIELSKVTQIFKRKVNEIYQIYFDNNTSLKVTGNHPLYTTKNKWVNVEKLKLGDEIYYLNSFQSKRYIYMKPNEKNSMMTYRIGYLCGTILGDGHFDDKRNRIEWNIVDKDFVRRICKYLKIIFNYNCEPKFNKKLNIYRILIGNKLIYTFLKDYSIKKEEMNNYFKRGFVAGFFDAEGSMCNDKNQWTISMHNTNKKLLYYILGILKQNNFNKFTFRCTKPNKNTSFKPLYGIFNTNNDSLLFFKIFSPSILRKYPKFDECSKFLENGLKINRIIKKQNFKRGFTVYNLEVEGNNNYFANNLLAHNCCRYYTNDEIVLVSSDKDWEMLCNFPNVKIFSPHTKKYKIVKNPMKVLMEKIHGDVSDNLLTVPSSEAEFERRRKIVDLINILPENIENPIKEKFQTMMPKNLHLNKIPYNTMRERIRKLYKIGE